MGKKDFLLECCQHTGILRLLFRTDFHGYEGSCLFILSWVVFNVFILFLHYFVFVLFTDINDMMIA